MTSTGLCLTTKDFAVLEVMLERRRAFADPIVHMLEHKLSSAGVVAVDSVEPGIVTLNSRVVFRIDAGPAETRTLVQSEGRGPVGSSLSIATRRGLCMLGMAQGQTAVIEQADGRRETILIKAVLTSRRPRGAQSGTSPGLTGGRMGSPSSTAPQPAGGLLARRPECGRQRMTTPVPRRREWQRRMVSKIGFDFRQGSCANRQCGRVHGVLEDARRGKE